MLVESLYEPFVFINKVTVNDAEGSVIATYVEGAKFMATKKPDRSLDTAVKNVGQKNVAVPSWQIAVPATVRLNHGDIIKHIESGQIYRVTGNDFKAAKIATYQFNVATVEEWELPNE
ncbi:hypothetical protein [Treponema sp.]|uniref:hypothetical protein n=1 Tax=Treponema sp. TaxID=166 RepID=UPI00388ECD6D